MQKRALEKCARITEIASRSFMDRGFRGVSTHEIAAEAHVTQGLIRYHFNSKHGLWQAAMDNVFGRFRNSLRENWAH